MSPIEIKLYGTLTAAALMGITMLIGFKTSREKIQEFSVMLYIVAFFFLFLFVAGGIGRS